MMRFEKRTIDLPARKLRQKSHFIRARLAGTHPVTPGHLADRPPRLLPRSATKKQSMPQNVLMPDQSRAATAHPKH
jgi:hypothetical protein